jgi:hypothetical protein
MKAAHGTQSGDCSDQAKPDPTATLPLPALIAVELNIGQKYIFCLVPDAGESIHAKESPKNWVGLVRSMTIFLVISTGTGKAADYGGDYSGLDMGNHEPQ